MRRLIFAPLVLVFGALPAMAACPSHPDSAATYYVENRTALAVCLQRELDQLTDEAAQRAAIDAAIGNIEIELQRQRMLATEWATQPAWP